MKTLGQIAYESRNDGLKDVATWEEVRPAWKDEWEATASAVATEAVERFKASLAEQSGEPLGKTATVAFKETIDPRERHFLLVWDEMREGDRRAWQSAALAVKARVLAELDGPSHEELEELASCDQYRGIAVHESYSGQKPEPSLLEVAATIYAGLVSRYDNVNFVSAIEDAEGLIAAVREHEKAPTDDPRSNPLPHWKWDGQWWVRSDNLTASPREVLSLMDAKYPMHEKAGAK